MSELSFACLLGAPSETWSDTFAQMSRYTRLTVDVEAQGADRFVLKRKGGQLWVVDTRANPNDFPELTESTFARIVCTSRRMFGENRLVKAIQVTHAAPAYRAEYDRIFRVPVVFESDENALLTDDALLTYKTRILPQRVTEVLLSHADGLLKELESSSSTKSRVERLLMPVLHTAEARMDLIARKLGLSRQGLFRKLKAEGVTFEKVLDEQRRKMALHYLMGKKLSVSETAYLVGFSEPPTFSRAFKRWTGSSPGKMRAFSNVGKGPTGLS